MGQWACLRCLPLRRARWPLRKRLPRQPPQALLLLSGVGTRWPRFTSWDSPPKFRTFRRAAAPRWNFSVGGIFRAWRPFPTNERLQAAARDRGKLENVQDAGGNAGVLRGV